MLPQTKNINTDKTMKKITWFLLFFILQSTSQAQVMTEPQARSYALSILKKYAPEGYEVINTYENAAYKYKIGETTITLNEPGSFMRYVSGRKKEDILASLGTAVHEFNHGYTSHLPYQIIEASNGKIPYTFGDDYLVYFINSQEKILVKTSPTFPSKTLANTIPKELRTFRFSTYIQGSSSTQDQGIYGLLDEMNAYRMDTQTSFLLYDYYKNELKAEDEKWLEYMQNIDGTLFAHMEFKYYILKYLLHAQKKEPETYQGIVQNQRFKEAFLKIEKNFTDLANVYFERRNTILADIKAKGLNVDIDQEYTYIGNTGIGNFMEVYVRLQEELKKQEYEAMMKILQK